ncbi:MAG: cytochrome c [Eudoraea sp.]|nr:cytochrome c [Eudoraea sp.]NNJ38186.1 cytochrome c [Flavobacteriaceae bacterium]MBT8206333.1 cytochrome c [Eudoraea sp.]MBT8221980.1 cytochrome c [Eudoraea sp.]MBT8311784.1 cytochrome c [Eudoraea sp.]
MKYFILGYLILIALLANTLFQDKELAESMERGKEIYADFCVTCHLENGEGVLNTFPPLAKSDYLAKNRESSIRGVKYGQRGEMTVNGVVYNNTMMPMGLEDEEIADVLNFVMNSWGNQQDKPVTPQEVSEIGPR